MIGTALPNYVIPRYDWASACKTHQFLSQTVKQTMSIVAFEKFHGYLVGEEGATRGLVVIQEWWGLNEDIKSIATRYSKEGFLVLAPDLYYGKIAHNADEAHHFMDGLDWHDAQAMVSAGARLLKSKGAKAVGVTGFCMVSESFWPLELGWRRW
ncbi:dienelactone hydrolase family-domain-containing protein [Jimgerdemannia flammicorona]|uniref:Dienelactone hydrolase family-domain-containing protein n=1 Tax=Jimgerdemannia flammicorona TaxID=994334 RepID=A0A433DJH4_9FUNG|nr:dienelactone hydrolase family-domain-containing protein [Jimgerdemannia flammicorona]